MRILANMVICNAHHLKVQYSDLCFANPSVPLTLLLFHLAETGKTLPSWLLLPGLAVFVIARLSHAYAMISAKDASGGLGIWRVFGMASTMITVNGLAASLIFKYFFW